MKIIFLPLQCPFPFLKVNNLSSWSFYQAWCRFVCFYNPEITLCSVVQLASSTLQGSTDMLLCIRCICAVLLSSFLVFLF